MLTRLELSGFKSFADKTRLEFPPGVSAIVGPNGSGKSNVVDAIRWVLGEQSAKSLRGDGMTDVIFNGSATRKPMAQAEVVLVLDNQAGHFPLAVPEVRIARRVHRSGESEYLINGKPCRLKDIRDLFLGSGAGSDSFCVIQQGQVHALLQASPRDRRSLFEEAAGISRFKSRRQETHKRLEKIDQNIARMEDVLSEVESQYRTANLQASKATRHRELRELIRSNKLRICWQETREIHARLPEIENSLGSAEEITGENSTPNLESPKAILVDLELEANRHATKAEEARTRLEQVQKGLDGAFQSRQELERDFLLAMQRKARLLLRWRDSSEWIQKAEEEILATDSELGEIQPQASVIEENFNEARARLANLREQADTNRARQLDALRRQNQVASQVSTLENSLDLVEQAQARLTSTKGQRLAEMERLQSQVTLLETEEARSQISASIALAELETARQEKDANVRRLSSLQARNHTLLVERGEIRTRLEVLEQLELSQEGLAPGVRAVLELKKSGKNKAWNHIVGLVADYLRVRRDYAHLVEIALGDNAQRFLGENRTQVIAALTREKQELVGRVGFVFPEVSRDSEEKFSTPLVNHPGLVARASHLVRCEHKKFITLPDRLLGNTLIVRDLDTAFELADKMPGQSFVTLAGEMVDACGAVVVGRQALESGVLSRKNELKDLRERLTEVEKSIQDLDARLSSERANLESVEARLETLDVNCRELTQTATELASRLERERLSLDSARQEQIAGQQEERRLLGEKNRLSSELAEARKMLESAEKATNGFQALLNSILRQVEESSALEASAHSELDTLRSKVGQLDLKLQLLRKEKGEKAVQIKAFLEDISREERDIRDRWNQIRTLDKTLLDKGMEQAVCLTNRDIARKGRRLAEQQLSHKRHELEQAALETSQALQEINKKRNQLSTLERERERLLVRLEQVQERLREENISDTGQISPEPEWETTLLDRDRTLESIREWQTQIQKLGLVNQEAAQELALLEERKQLLGDQLGDLQAARKNLLDTLEALNKTATERFVECFGAIQEHFRDLFRKVFGGGTAEISLEDPANPLDSGIEVLARPPGKDAARLSLMSGGERTMTAVALLLAVFRSKPGPFCLMDEVDAALDEANVDRFAGVLKEFSQKTQFILISHHKRTMASAGVLHGITMREPGVSTRYSVDVEEYLRQPEKGSPGSGPLAA